MVSTGSLYGTFAGSYEHGNESYSSIRRGEFIDQLRNLPSLMESVALPPLSPYAPTVWCLGIGTPFSFNQPLVRFLFRHDNSLPKLPCYLVLDKVTSIYLHYFSRSTCRRCFTISRQGSSFIRFRPEVSVTSITNLSLCFHTPTAFSFLQFHPQFLSINIGGKTDFS